MENGNELPFTYIIKDSEVFSVYIKVLIVIILLMLLKFPLKTG